MAETFYSALGVESDADGEAIQAAFRERVKENHPDVSDDPGAPREFKRLTTARAVLIDEDERARYDRLGHATYVDRHLETSAWTSDARNAASSPDSGKRGRSTGRSDAERGGGRTVAGSARHRRTRTAGDDRSAWLGDDWERPGRSRREQQSGPGRGGDHRGAATAGWQHASDVYRNSPASGDAAGRRMGGTATSVLGSLGPWLVVHLVFLLTAIGTAVYAYASIGVVSRLSIPGVAFGVLLVGLVVTLSALHVVSLLYG